MKIYGSSAIPPPDFPLCALDDKKVLRSSNFQGLLLEIWKPEDFSDILKTENPTCE